MLVGLLLLAEQCAAQDLPSPDLRYLPLDGYPLVSPTALPSDERLLISHLKSIYSNPDKSESLANLQALIYGMRMRHLAVSELVKRQAQDELLALLEQTDQDILCATSKAVSMLGYQSNEIVQAVGKLLLFGAKPVGLAASRTLISLGHQTDYRDLIIAIGRELISSNVLSEQLDGAGLLAQYEVADRLVTEIYLSAIRDPVEYRRGLLCLEEAKFLPENIVSRLEQLSEISGNSARSDAIRVTIRAIKSKLASTRD